jgi:hypothetical protein
MKKIVPILVVSILVLSGLGAVATQFSETECEKTHVSFSAPSIEEEQDHLTIDIKEADSYLMKQNQPMLPKYTKTFTYPFGTKIKSVTVTPKNIETKTLSKEIVITPKMQVAGKVAKTQSLKTTSSVYPDNWFDYNVYGGLVGDERSVIVNVEIYPVKYNSNDLTIKVAEDVDIEIEFEESEPGIRALDDNYEFVIITEDYFDYSLDRLVSHKEYRDISTKLVTLSDIYWGTYFDAYGRDDQELIKYFIKNAIEQWGTQYVMLVGRDLPNRDTHVQVSSEDTEIFVSDLYYADIYDGKGQFSSWDSNNNDLFAEVNWYGSISDELDLYPDVHLARLACNDVDEVETVIDKIVNYEDYYAYDSAWFRDIVVAGGDSFPGDYNQVLEGELVNEYILGIMDDFSPERIWVSHEDLVTRGPLNNALNGGCGFVDFSGHGNTNVWCTHPHTFEGMWLPAGTGYLSTNVLALNNGDELPIVITGACSVGKYNVDSNCFSWSWLKNEDGGGIGSFGATGLGYAYMGEYVTYGLIERMTIETFSAYKGGATKLGQMWSGAIDSYLRSIGLESEADYKAVLEWQCFGDPTLAIADQPNSDPPEKPQRPDGPTEGDTGVDYTYTTLTEDPEGDEVYYMFDWGDGSSSGWQGPFYSGEQCSVSHAFMSSGEFWIKVKAKDSYGVQGPWSDPLGVSMPRNRLSNFPILEKILGRLQNIFPILNLIV